MPDKRKKRDNGNKKQASPVELKSVHLEMLKNETEREEAFSDIFSFLFDGLLDLQDVMKTRLKGIFGNEIVKYEVSLKGQDKERFIDRIISSLNLSDSEIDLRLSPELVFSVKLDKQAACTGQFMSTASGSDCIQVQAKFAAWGRKEDRRRLVLALFNRD